MNDDDDFFFQLGAIAAVNASNLLFQQQLLLANTRTPIDKRGTNSSNRSNKRRKFDHEGALNCINRDYLGPTPLHGSQFKLQFRMSLSRFERLVTDLMATPADKFPFFKVNETITGNDVASLQARLLLPLKTYAYGVATHAFIDYFSCSMPFANQCCREFDSMIVGLYQEEYLRKPTKEDIKEIVSLHKHKHHIDGLLGSLDCTHIYWKNCPVAWKGQYQGRNATPSFILESVSDFHGYMWYLSYGHCGCLNDINVLNRSPLLESMLDGSLHDLEKEAGVVPYKIGEEEFDKLFFLVDGIYPRYVRFVKSYKLPITQAQKWFSSWQEAVRKDIERAFGVLKGRWQVLARPIQLHKPDEIALRATCCFILHNMLVSDRVMNNDVNARYKPTEGLDLPAYGADDVTQPVDINDVQARHNNNNTNQNGGDAVVDEEARHHIGQLQHTRGSRYRELINLNEFSRMHEALLRFIGGHVDE
jgi:hypothetical protein